MQLFVRSISLAAFWSVACSIGFGAEYYVAPSGGSDSNNGSIGSPFATFSKAIGLAAPGDTIFARGGTYNLSSTVSIGGSRSGTAANPIKLLAYPGESPVLDFRSQPYNASNGGLKGISLNGSYWHVKGLTVQYAADNGIAIGGSHNVVEQVVSRQNQDSGFQISGGGQPSNNLILNCDSYANFDFGAGGENADGFAVKFRDLGPGNVLSGVRAWENADDGFDFWEARNGITVLNSWSFHNGIASVFNNPGNYQGDGNGIKLGHDSGTHQLSNMLIWGNPANGVDVNGNATQVELPDDPINHGVEIYNVTAANNSRNFRFDEDPTEASPPTTHILRNNISFAGTGVTIDSGNTTDHNTFAGPGGTPAGLGVSAADFVSTVDPVFTPGSYYPAGSGGDRSGVTTALHATGPAVAPRLPDGSLPSLDFLRLAAGSHLIDAGVDVSLPFNGSAPDLGWIESIPPGPALPGDYNGDNIVDARDYTVWRDAVDTGATLPNDASPETVDSSDYEDSRVNFGQSLPGLGGIAEVPEPAIAVLISVAICGLIFSRRMQAHSSR